MKVDGVPLQNLVGYRVLSPDFTFTVGPDNAFGITCASGPPCTGNASGDGYYLMLAPLPAGPHVIDIVADGFGIDAKISLTVGH